MGRARPQGRGPRATPALLMPDHFGAQLATGPALTAAADATPSLRVGTLVLDNDYKHPVVTAKEMATLDLLSDGRLELGIGAGWMASDYEQSGIPLDPPGVRVDRLAEAIAILKGLFAPGRSASPASTTRSPSSTASPSPCRAAPAVHPRGRGRACCAWPAREADIVGINPALRSGKVDAETAQDGVAAATDRKVELVHDAAGARYAEMELNMLVFGTVITEDRAGTIEAFAPAVRVVARRAGRVPPRTDRDGRPGGRGPHRPAGAMGRVVPRRAGRRGHGGPGPRRRQAGGSLTRVHIALGLRRRRLGHGRARAGRRGSSTTCRSCMSPRARRATPARRPGRRRAVPVRRAARRRRRGARRHPARASTCARPSGPSTAGQPCWSRRRWPTRWWQPTSW